MDMRNMPGGAVPGVSNVNMMDTSFMRQIPNQSRPMPVSAPFPADPRQRADPRVKSQPPMNQPPPMTQPPPVQPSAANRIPNGIPTDATDQEKAALIMQVLQVCFLQNQCFIFLFMKILTKLSLSFSFLMSKLLCCL